MWEHSALRRARFAALVVAISSVAAAAFAGPAMADTSTITAANATAVPEQAIPVDLTFSGTNNLSTAAEVEAVVRPAGGLPCQSSFQDDISAVGSEDQILFGPAAEMVAAGPGTAYHVTASYKPSTPTGFQVCAWLQQNQSNSDQPVAGPSTVTFTARAPQVSQLAVSLPKALTPNVPFEVSYTTQTDQSLTLYSIIMAAPAPTTSTSSSTAGSSAQECPSSFEVQQQQGDVETLLFGFPGQSVFGGPATSTASAKEKTGFYVICTWIEGPNGAEVDATATTQVTVGSPVIALPKPGLALSKVTASHRHGVSATGKTRAAFSGHLVLAAACGSSTAKRTTTAKKGRFSGTVGLPAACRKAKRVTVTLTWAGSSSYAKQSITRSVAIGK
jgi:hypothetical protein